MYDFVVHVHRRAISFEREFHDVHGTHHPRAESPRPDPQQYFSVRFCLHRHPNEWFPKTLSYLTYWPARSFSCGLDNYHVPWGAWLDWRARLRRRPRRSGAATMARKFPYCGRERGDPLQAGSSILVLPSSADDEQTVSMRRDEMRVEPVVLEGSLVRLEPLSLAHHSGLSEVGLDEELWRWIPTPIRTGAAMAGYIENGP